MTIRRRGFVSFFRGLVHVHSDPNESCGCQMWTTCPKDGRLARGTRSLRETKLVERMEISRVKRPRDLNAIETGRRKRPRAGVVMARQAHTDVFESSDENKVVMSPPMEREAADIRCTILPDDKMLLTRFLANFPVDTASVLILQETRQRWIDLELAKTPVDEEEIARSYTIDQAAQNGNLDMVERLHGSQKEGCTSSAMDGAAQNGHLKVVEWLHKYRTEGCTTDAAIAQLSSYHFGLPDPSHTHRTDGCTPKAMDGAIQNCCFEVIEWLVRNRTELEMTDKHLGSMIKCRHPSLVPLHYDRDELKSWPRPAHTRILFALFQSGYSVDVSILQHIVRNRQNCYRSNAPDNPFCANDDDFESANNQEHKGIILASVTNVCEGRGIADENCMLISDFVAGDPSRVCTHTDALTRGWVHWLLRYSNQPSRDIEHLV